MSRAAMLSKAATASTADKKPATLRISRPGDKFEQEADRAAAAVTEEGNKRAFSISRLAMNPPETGGILVQRAAAPAPAIVAPSIDNVTRGPGRTLDQSARDYMEPRFGRDFSQVRVHTDAAAARAAQDIAANAYTIGKHIVFGPGKYRPDSMAGKKLLAHELAHVIQQDGAPNGVIQRDSVPEIELIDAPKSDTVLGRAFEAADAKRWQDAARLSNGLSPDELNSFIKTLKNPELISWLHIGALGAPGVGKDSAVAKATKVQYLDYNFAVECRQGNWQRAAWFINDFNAVDIRARFKRLNTATLKAVHEGAVANAELGENSAAAKASAEILAERSAKGETAALLLPTIRGGGKEKLLSVMRIIDGMHPAAPGSDDIILTVDGQPQKIKASQAAAIRRGAAGVLKDHLRTIRTNAATAEEGYLSQDKIDKNHWFFAPIVKTLGRVKDPGPDLLAYAARAKANVEAADAAIAAGNFAQAADLLAGADSAAVAATKMWQAYFKGIIGAGEMTVNVLEVTRDAAVISLGILTTIASGGAAAAALAGEGATTTTVAFGVDLGVSATTAANTLAVAAPVIANLAEAAAKVSMGDKVDWGALVVDTAVQIIIARFGGKVTGGIAKALLGNPATENLAARVTEKIVHTAIMHVGSTALTSAARQTYGAFKGQAVTWQTFMDDLITRLTDPKSLAVLAVTGAISASSEAHFGGPRLSGPAPKDSAGETNAQKTASRQTRPPPRAKALTDPLPAKSDPVPDQAPPATKQTAAQDAATPAPPKEEITAREPPPAAGAKQPAGPPPGGGFGGGGDITDAEMDALFADPKAAKPGLRVPVEKSGAPAKVLEAGSGPKETNLGLPPTPGLIEVTESDIAPSRPGVMRLDATKPVPPELKGKYDTVLINNPRKYVPNIEELGAALKPNGRIIVQGKAEEFAGQRGINPDFQKLLDAPAPPGFKKEIDVPPGPPGTTKPEHILGGPFYRTTGEPVNYPNARIIYSKLPIAEGGGPPPVTAGSPAAPAQPALEPLRPAAMPAADAAKPPVTANGTPTPIKPVNGIVNVGGGLEEGSKLASNLNPIVKGTGGPTKGIPNHINAGFEDIDKMFEPGSVTKLISRKLPSSEINWEQAAAGAAKVMAPGGKVAMNVWQHGTDDSARISAAFKAAGFKNIKVAGEGAGTVIVGER